MILGHVHYGLHTHINGPSTYITLLREPVSRVLSLYRYIAASPQHHLHDRVVKQRLIDFVSGDTDADEVENGQTRQIAGVPGRILDSPSLALAKKHLAENFGVVGLVERFDESLILLKRRLGWRMPLYVRKNVTEGAPPPDPTDEEAIEIVRERNTLDAELYSYARELFLEQAGRGGASFGAEVTLFRALNAAARVGRGGREMVKALRRDAV
jgi:hypothetical protein